MICNQQRAECAQKRHSPECGFRSTHLIASSDEYARNIPRAMRPGWLARAAFYFAQFLTPQFVAPASRRLSGGRPVICSAGVSLAFRRTSRPPISRPAIAPLVPAAAADREWPRAAWDREASNSIALSGTLCDRAATLHSVRAAHHIL